MANSNSSSSSSAVTMRESQGPPCRCTRSTSMMMSWTDDNPGRRFYRCEEHGFVAWADKEKPGGWQKDSLLEARDQIRRYRQEVSLLKESLREARQQLNRERSLQSVDHSANLAATHELLHQEVLKREKILRHMFAVSWGGFIVVTATIIYMLKQ